MDPELHDILCSQLDRLYKFAYNRTRDAYKAEDLVQEIVLSAIRSYHGVKDKNLILPWLWGVARNVYMRSLHPGKEIPTEEHSIIDIAGISYETPEDKYIENEEVCNLRRAVSYLAKNYRDVAVMYYIEEKDYNTIARELSIPLSSVKWRLNQSKSQIREELETMDNNYMNEGYRKAQDLIINFGGHIGKQDWLGAYEGADKALETLLAKNIAIYAYDKPVTITEISSALGVSADYIEDTIDKMVETRSVMKTNNKYQTNFPILDGEQIRDIWTGNYLAAKEKANEIYEMLYSLKEEIQNLGFHGSEKNFESLLPMLISTVGKETKDNIFDAEKCPFKGTDKTWYILGMKELQEKVGKNGGGLNWNAYTSLNNSIEYHVHTPWFNDGRNHDEAVILRYLFYKINDYDEPNTIASMIEKGKIEKNGDDYKIKVTVFDENKCEYQKLIETLAPVIEFSNKLQEAINKRSLATVKKYIARFNSDEFFSTYFAHHMIEAALYDILHEKNIQITNDMVSWFMLRTQANADVTENMTISGQAYDNKR